MGELAKRDAAVDRPKRDAVKLGVLLRAEREKYGLSLDDVAVRLRIRSVYLQALEADDYQQLPGNTYATGFLKSYAEFLGLDRDDVIGRYQRRNQVESEVEAVKSLRHPIETDEPRIPRGAMMVLSIVLASAAVYGGSRLFSDNQAPAVDRVAAVPDRLITGSRPTTGTGVFTGRQDPSAAFAAVTPQPGENDPKPATGGTQPNVSSTPQPAAAPTPAPPPPQAQPNYVTLPRNTFDPQYQEQPLPKKDRLDLTQAPAPVVAANDPPPAPPAAAKRDPQVAAVPRSGDTAPPRSGDAGMPRGGDTMVVARVDSWIEIKDGSGRVLASQLLRVGESLNIPVGADYRLRTGDVRALDVRINGLSVPQRVAPDRVHKVLLLDGDRLQTGNAVVD